MRRRGIEWENITLNFCIVKEQKKGNARKCSTGKQKDWGVSKQGIKQETNENGNVYMTCQQQREKKKKIYRQETKRKETP